MAKESDKQRLQKLLEESHEWNRYHHDVGEDEIVEHSRGIEINRLREKIEENEG